MLIVESIELNKTTVATNETFLIKVTVREEMADWGFVKTKTWFDAKNSIWDQIKRKIFNQ